MKPPIESCHDGFRPGRLWSLWDMLTHNARYFIDLGAEFYELGVMYYVPDGDSPIQLTGPELGGVQAHLEKVYTLCTELKLSIAQELIRTHLDYQTLPRTLEIFEILRDAVYAELKDKWFAYLPSHRLDYFQGRKIASEAVQLSFPLAYQEIRSAGNCYVFDEYTACVFHSMRAAEIGVRALGSALRIELQRPIEQAEWQQILNGIAGKIRDLENQPSNTPNKESDVHFYSEAAAQFRFFKNGWRVRVAHARATYTESQARESIDHVRSFFEFLVTRMTEGGLWTDEPS